MDSYCSLFGVAPQPEATVLRPAKLLEPPQRQDLAPQALAGTDSISGLAVHYDVSRKFVYQQVGTARAALDQAFAMKEEQADEVLFYLPVTEQWLEQAILGLTLICHSSIRGVGEFFGDLLDYPIAVGKVHNILQRAVGRARGQNCQQALSRIRIGAHDEIFQAGRPVLVGADVASTCCYLLSLEEQRDGDT
jgi:hypothetical protein